MQLSSQQWRVPSYFWLIYFDEAIIPQMNGLQENIHSKQILILKQEILPKATQFVRSCEIEETHLAIEKASPQLVVEVSGDEYAVEQR